MLTDWLLAILSVLLVSMISLIGLATISISPNSLKSLLIYFVSFAAGAMFGDAFIHLIPEAAESNGMGLSVSIYVLAGIAFSFIVEKIIHWRHCHVPQDHTHIHPFAIMNLVGDAVHNFIDGLIIAASYLASIPIGITTTLAVIFHEIPQEIGDFAVLLHGGYTKAKAIFFNVLTALTSVLGAAAALLLSNKVPYVTAVLVPFAAGNFIYIAGSDLIPELHKEVKMEKSILQLLAFLSGILMMMVLLVLE